MIYVNDHSKRESQTCQISDVPEIAGISAVEFQEKYNGDWQELNADLYEFDFSEEPKYRVEGEESEEA